MCGKVSISFDPFNMLSLPIPLATKELRLNIKYFPRSLTDPPREFQFLVGEFATLNEIKQRIAESIPPEQNLHPPFITRVKNKNVIELLDKEKFIKSFVERGDEIVAFERPPLPENHGDNFFLLELKICQNRRSYLWFSGVQQIATSRLFIMDKRMTARQLKIAIFKFFRPLLTAQRPPSSLSGKPLPDDDDKSIE